MAFQVFILFIFLSFLQIDCGESQDSKKRYRLMPVESVEIADTVLAFQSISFTAKVGTPTPCWKFHRFDIGYEGERISIRTWAEDEGLPCVQVLGSFKATGEVKPLDRGSYSFHFWQSDETSLVKTVFVK